MRIFVLLSVILVTGLGCNSNSDDLNHRQTNPPARMNDGVRAPTQNDDNPSTNRSHR